jgi:hypothetical protein
MASLDWWVCRIHGRAAKEEEIDERSTMDIHVIICLDRMKMQQNCKERCSKSQQRLATQLQPDCGKEPRPYSWWLFGFVSTIPNTFESIRE